MKQYMHMNWLSVVLCQQPPDSSDSTSLLWTVEIFGDKLWTRVPWKLTVIPHFLHKKYVTLFCVSPGEWWQEKSVPTVNMHCSYCKEPFEIWLRLKLWSVTYILFDRMVCVHLVCFVQRNGKQTLSLMQNAWKSWKYETCKMFFVFPKMTFETKIIAKNISVHFILTMFICLPIQSVWSGKSQLSNNALHHLTHII
jgi:hypothetical protein